MDTNVLTVIASTLASGAISFAVSKWNWYRENKFRHELQQHSVLYFYKAILEIDATVLKKTLDTFADDSFPLPIVPLSIDVSMSDLSMSHADNQFIKMRRNTPSFSYGDISRPFFFAKF